MRKFRDFKIIRTCKNKYRTCHSYRKFLKIDFHNRCAYCNILDSLITTPFEIDHFIPRKTFEKEKPEYSYLYENLIYSCKKCNDAKGSQYSGDITNGIIENKLFYNPVQTDYGNIFYRDDSGTIQSNDVLGCKMIDKLKLYRPIHNMAWLCEMIDNTLFLLSEKMEQIDKSSEKYKYLEQAERKLYKYNKLCIAVLTKNYNDEKFKIT